MAKVFDPKAKVDGVEKFDELNGKWVSFPNGKEYLLPVIQKQQQLVPVFKEDGTVEMSVRHRDNDLADSIGKFLNVLVGAEGNQLVLAANSYSEFVILVRRLLAQNYSFDKVQLTEILTLTHSQFAALFNTIILHIR